MIRNHAATDSTLPAGLAGSISEPIPFASPLMSHLLASVYDGKHEGYAASRDVFLDACAGHQLSRRRAGETLARMRDAGLVRLADTPRAYLLTDHGRARVQEYFAAARGDDAGVPSAEWVEEG